MRSASLALAIAATSAAVQLGCGDSDSESTAGDATEGAAVSFSREDVTVGNLLAETRGHYRAALERYAAGDREAALEHARHPAKEVLDSVRPELEEHSPGATEELRRALARVPAAAERGEPARRVEAIVEDATRATREAERQVVGEAAASDAYQGSVVAALLGVAAHEYEEALAGGRIRRLDEYQDAYGFVREASAMYRGIATAVERKSAKEAAEIEEAFDRLEQALPSGDEPRRPASLEDVERSATLIGAELEETVGAKLPTASAPDEVRENIDRLLDQVVKTYRPDDPQTAAELVAEAYLENYEVIEGAVIDAAPQVNAKLEPLLGAELRKRIRAGAPRAEIESMVERAKRLLAQAVRAVEEGG